MVGTKSAGSIRHHRRFAAAGLLGIIRRTICRKMQKYGIALS
jgi:DNA-binding protein Fis